MAKSKKELEGLKKEYEELSEKFRELTPDELTQVTGGAAPTPGVEITQTSAQPGKGYRVAIRGIGSAGDAGPLYVIDGVAGGSIAGVEPNDIESIDVLRD